MATEKGRKIAEYAKSKIGCAYIWGGYGEKKCSVAFRKERASAYPSQKNNIYKNCPVLSGKQSSCSGCKYEGKQAYDCAQLTRYSCKAAGQELCSGANSQWKTVAWAKKGTMDNFPDVEGVILYHANSKGTMTHTGVAIGGGKAVEAKNADYKKGGVVKTNIADRTWTHWAALDGVLDGVQVEELKVEQIVVEGDTVNVELNVLRKGSKGKQVKTLQRLLIAEGCDVGKAGADGDFGSMTESAVKEYQKKKGLETDGIVGKITWSSLLK